MNKDILIIGLGQIGYHNAEYITSRGLNVEGYDINKRAVQRALADEVICGVASTFHDYDYYIICISTHNPNNIYKPYLNGLFEITKQLSSEGKTDALVGIESTISIGTSNKVINTLNHRLHVAHLPHRFYEQEKSEHGVRQTRVLGGCDDCCLDQAIYFYGDLLDIPLKITEAVEYAELSKLIENAYRYLEIAFSEELFMACDYLNLDFNTLRDAVNSKWNVELLEAKAGIDGHCLPKDSQMYLDIVKNLISTSTIAAAQKVDKEYREHLKEIRQLNEQVQYELLEMLDKSSTIH